MIKYEGVYKIFGRGENSVTAVENVSFEVEKGELVTLLGPSGCGKTTLLRLTNRLIGLTRGKITVDGRDINDVNPVKLRQSMGYAIQAIGLFPNKTIYGNIATVPRLLKWDEKRIAKRVDELLSMLRLDPERFRDRYPPELSGGQQQRVGVARCLAADPEILLMDEPFGAIDPINRVEIQDEFLRVQDELKKTILFVTHDIQEAIKMGDKIAIFEQGRLVQYDAPDTILLKPKNDYIADFVGADRGLKVLGLREIRHAFNPEPENLLNGDTNASNALKKLLEKGFDHGIVIKNEKPVGYVKTPDLENRRASVQDLAESFPKCVSRRDNLKDVMSLMFMHDIEHLCVVDDDGNFEGTISMRDIQKTIMAICADKDKEEQ